MQSWWNTLKTALSTIDPSNVTFSLRIYTIRCAFSMPIQWFYFHCKRVRTDAAILRITKMNQNPSKICRIWKKSVRTLSSANGCKRFSSFNSASVSWAWDTQIITPHGSESGQKYSNPLDSDTCTHCIAIHRRTILLRDSNRANLSTVSGHSWQGGDDWQQSPW